ncbi:MAG TPA: DUF305 domain-containing protein [Gemmatimonadaceae bacterium]|nr:DUF305 domain-containing protein [Gemmatimonadaceae bacterium]
MSTPRISIAACAVALYAIIPLGAQAPTRVMGAPYNNASRAFIDVMIPHHEMALMMSQRAIEAARSDSVKALAKDMLDQRRKEIGDLKAARRALFGSDSTRGSMMEGMMPMMTQMMGMQHDSAMRGQMMGQMMADFDRMFLQHMISHQQEGIDIALLAEHSQAATRVKELAVKTRESQERDLARMRRLLAKLPVPAAAQPPRKP